MLRILSPNLETSYKEFLKDFRTTSFSFIYKYYATSFDCELLVYADETCLIFQHKGITEIETALNKNFSMLCDWFADNKLNIHFDKDTAKSILLGSKHKSRSQNY